MERRRYGNKDLYRIAYGHGTERLIIRKITRKDMGALLALMSKPEVMYAWEHGFEKKEVHQWLNRQLTRYRKDRYGYFAVILKENNKFIGQQA